MRFPRILILAAVAVAAAVLAPGALAVRFTDESFKVPIGVVGQPYKHQFTGAAGCGPALPYQYRVLSGGLPPGLTLSKSGLISGTPTTAGSWSFYVELSDEDPPSASWCRPAKAEREFTINVMAGLTITTPDAPPPATLGQPFSLPLTYTGGGNPSWTVSGTLPPGLSLVGSAITGTPTTVGSYSFKIKIADDLRFSEKSFSVNVRDALKVVVPPVPSAEVSRPFALKIAVTGGFGSDYTITPTGLPAGLALDPATATIAGKPEAAGSFPVKLTVGDKEGRTTAVDLVIVVNAKLAIKTLRLKTARAGRDYSAALKTVGGVGPTAWKIIHGRPPAGVQFDRTTGELAGIPLRAGVFTITFRVRDSLGAIANVTLVLTVRGAKK